MIKAFKIGNGKSDGEPVFALLGEDGKFHVSEFTNFTKEICEEIGYIPIPSDVMIELDQEQKELNKPLIKLVEELKEDKLWD